MKIEKIADKTTRNKSSGPILNSNPDQGKAIFMIMLVAKVIIGIHINGNLKSLNVCECFGFGFTITPSKNYYFTITTGMPIFM